MSQCEKCSCRLDEDDTFELVLCGHCYRGKKAPPKYHCVKCASVVKWNDLLKRISSLHQQYGRTLWVAGLLAVATLIVLPFSPKLALQLALGIVAIPITILALILVVCLVIFAPYKLGSAVNRWLDLGMSSLDDSPTGFLRYLLGLFVVASPFLIYWFGGWILHLFA